MKALPFFVFPAILTLSLSCQRPASVVQLELRLNDDRSHPNAGTVEVLGLAPDLLGDLEKLDLNRELWQAVFAVYVGESLPTDSQEKPPILGDYKIDDDAISFKPRFPFRPDLTHNARLNLTELYALVGQEKSNNKDWLEATFPGGSEVSIPTTTVTEVYPTTDKVPANLLRFYVHFSAPMSRRAVNDYLHIFDFNGNQVPLPFVEIETGLWDRNQQRLTLFFHPGRIKRGVGPNLAMGAPLQEGETYHLIIDKAWKDASGNPMAAGFRKTFTVVRADREALDYKAWTWTAPAAGSRQSLNLEFPEPLDRALLMRMLTVEDRSGRTIPGQIEVQNQETEWRFKPRGKWQVGQYKIAINTSLEDLAGNNLRGVFDRDVKEQSEPEVGDMIEVPFEIKGSNRT